jgi:hypothetical protein
LLREVAQADAVFSTTECRTHGYSCDCDRMDCEPQSRVLAYGVEPELMIRIKAALKEIGRE